MVKYSLWIAVLMAGLAGCNEAIKRPLEVRPVPAVPQRPSFVTQPLPFPASNPETALLVTRPQPSVDELIDAVQTSFDAGQKDYQAGNLDKARREFNHAVDLIVASGFTTDADPRLELLFDHITDTMHAYELEAAQPSGSEGAEGEETVEPETPTVAAPIEEIADLNLPAGDPRLALKAEQELMSVPHDLPLTVNDSVLSYLSFFQTPRGRAIVENGLQRAGRYRAMIERVLKQEGLPGDLIYLAQAESAFQPRAASRAGARGIWQFMPFRAREYDLRRNWWVDERDDPVEATRAAAEHLRDLYQTFGDWYLVMAAYNSGPLSVARAIEHTGYADFWELEKRNALPGETKNYVPIILAMALIAKDPGLYGIQVTPDSPLQSDVVRPGHPIDLRLAADMTGASLETLEMLNPELIHLVTPNDPEFDLHLPRGTADRFRAEIAEIPWEKWRSWRVHEVQPGETLFEIARRYRVSTHAILAANHFTAHSAISSGEELIIPANASVRHHLVRYRVRRGDTLEGIASRFEVTVDELRRWNRLRGDRARPGARLRIYEDGEFLAIISRSSRARGKGAARGSETWELRHRVKPGETLWSIARAYGTSVESLRRANPFLSDRELEAGDIVTILPHP